MTQIILALAAALTILAAGGTASKAVSHGHGTVAPADVTSPDPGIVVKPADVSSPDPGRH